MQTTMTSLVKVYTTYDFAVGGTVPSEFIEAHLNALEIAAKRPAAVSKAARAAHINRVNVSWRRRNSKLAATGKTRRLQTRVSFGAARYVTQGNPAKVVETAPLSDKIGREITSGGIIEKKIMPLLTKGGSLGFAVAWEKHAAGTPLLLDTALLEHGITRVQLIKDMRHIMNAHERGLSAILGYRSSWRLPPLYDALVLRTNILTLRREWKKTGRRFPLFPKFRRYMIKVIKDEDTAARRITAFLLRHRSQ